MKDMKLTDKGMCYLEGERGVVGGCEANKGALPGR